MFESYFSQEELTNTVGKAQKCVQMKMSEKIIKYNVRMLYSNQGDEKGNEV